MDVGMRASDELLDLDRVAIDPGWALRVPALLALRRELLPIACLDGVVQVACAHPHDQAALQAVQRHLGRPVRGRGAELASLRRALTRLFRDGRAALPDNDAVSACDALLQGAALRGASDIHLDPGREGLRVRFRVDGVLEEVRALPGGQQPRKLASSRGTACSPRLLPGELHAELISRLKVMAGLDIAEKRAPQDGRFSFTARSLEREVDVRAATLPTRYGERMTLRLLALDAESLTLDRLGMNPTQLEVFRQTIRLPHGLVLLSGPTGSGKSTTLYAAIRMLIEGAALNVVTVEDPIEFAIDGVAQVEVDAADKINFGRALRAILRHDPDVIMIGEIRDRDSADIAVKAALTGHLVFSSVHTNTAAGVVTRLADMGLEPYLLGATLKLAVAQRLVRRLCVECRRARPLTTAEALGFGLGQADGEVWERGAGCVYCAGRGYRGRVGLFEMFRPDDALREAIAAGAHEATLVREARGRGAVGLVEDALAKARRGITSVDEALGSAMS